MTPPPCSTIFLSEKAEGLDLLGSVPAHPVHFLGSKRGDKTRIGAFQCQRSHRNLSFLRPNAGSCLQIYFYPPISPRMLSPSFSTSRPPFFHLAPALGCQFSHVESCLSYLPPVYSLHSDLLQYGQLRAPGLLFRCVQEFHEVMRLAWTPDAGRRWWGLTHSLIPGWNQLLTLRINQYCRYI